MAKRVPKDQVKSVTINLCDTSRKQLLALNKYQSELVEFDLPLSATALYAIRRAYAAMNKGNPVEEDNAPSDFEV